MKKNTNKYEVKVITKKGEQILIDAEDFDKVKRLFKAIMKISDQRDLYKQKIDLKISEYEEILKSPIIKDDYKREVEHIIRVLEELKGE